MIQKIQILQILSISALVALQALPTSAADPVPTLSERMLQAIEIRPVGPTVASKAMVATANPLASEAALKTLQKGGSAIDAAIAAAMVLSVVEPQSSGIGGGAFMLHFDAAKAAVESYDGRETAPAAATPTRFLKPDGSPMSWPDAVVGGLSVGVPGLLRMLDLAHSNHGILPWQDLFEDAIGYARDGFPISPRMASLIAGDERLGTFADTQAYFFKENGSPRTVGEILKNPTLATTLHVIATQGAAAFYQGPIAADIVATVQGASQNPGDLTVQDMATYKAIKRPAVCADYRGHTVCGMGPPSSGGLTTLMMLGLMRPFDLGAMDPASPKALHLIAEVGRIAFADRNAYMADSDFVDVPGVALLDDGYLQSRSYLIDPTKANTGIQPGTPDSALLPGGRPTPEHGVSTTHLSVVDADGNAVSMTASVETQFGSRLMARGMILNNQLTDFSFVPMRDGLAVANRVDSGKRPRSSMSPTLVFDENGAFKLAVGSPGGSSIIGFVAKTLFGVLDWKMDIQAAIDLPHVVNRGGSTAIEADRGLDDAADVLRGMGHEVTVRPMTSGLQGIAAIPKGLAGGVDKRREGLALGY